jgi:hypothetical protein
MSRYYYPRAEKLKESYYEKANYPTYNQLKEWHFSDEQGRQYTLAAENDDSFQNLALRDTKNSTQVQLDENGHVLLYVRLARKHKQQPPWFTSDESFLVLKERRTNEEYAVEVASEYRAPGKSTGVITVRGLTRGECNAILKEQY